MPSFSYFQTKLALTAGAILGVVALTAGVINLNPNSVSPTENGYQKPPPMSSLLEECGNFFWFDDQLIQKTNSDLASNLGTIVPVIPKQEVDPLPKKSFKYYPLEEMEELPTVDQVLSTISKYEGYVIWYSPGAKNDFVSSLSNKIEDMDENIMLIPWTGGHGGEFRQHLPQDRDYAFMSYNQITQSCNFAEPYSFTNFVSFAESQGGTPIPLSTSSENKNTPIESVVN